jgi:hypothetical protein
MEVKNSDSALDESGERNLIGRIDFNSARQERL